MNRNQPPSPDTAIEIKNLGVCLRKIDILTEVNCSIPARRTTAVIGPNGAGKTTLLLAILGLVPYTGSINFNLCRKDALPSAMYRSAWNLTGACPAPLKI